MRLIKVIRPKLLPISAFLLSCIFFFAPFLPATAIAAEKDFVIVIDVSTSMQDIFDEVKQQTNRTLATAEPGDNVAIIIFGERARLLDRKQIHEKADVEALQQEVNELYPTDYATYLNSGLEKSLSELRYLFEKNPDRERVLLWLSDDKDNPPPELGSEYLSLDDLRKKNERFKPDREWFAYQAPLSEVKNDRLEDFLTWVRRTTYRVGIQESAVNLGSFENEKVEKKVVLHFEPQHPGAAGLEFFTGMTLVDQNNPNRTIPVTLSPNKVVASAQPWQQEFKISFTGEPGEYQGEFDFNPVSKQLDVEPRKVIVTAMIAPPKVVEPVKEEEEKKTELDQVVSTAQESATGRPAGMDRPIQPLTFGPLEPGKKAVRVVTLNLNKEADAKSISQNLSIELPKGISVESKISGKRDTRLSAEITISVDPSIQLPEEALLQSAYEGNIRFVSSESGVQILPLQFPIRVEMNTDRVRWGRRILPATSAAPGMARRSGKTFEELTRELDAEAKGKTQNAFVAAVRSVYAKVANRYVVIPFVGVVLLIFILLLYRMRPVSELFSGELVIIKDPTDSKMKNIHLKRIGSLHGKDSLLVGSSPRAEIRLNHPSVAPAHCRLTAKRNDNRVEVSIVPSKGSLLKVNDIECSSKTRLSDKDLIGIGEFILLFSNPESQKEIVVHFRNGRTMRGTPVTWDIGSPAFELLRTDIEGAEETTEEIAVVKFETLKAVFFLQDAASETPGIPKDRIKRDEVFEITFFDGEKIEGNPLLDYSELAGRFYLVPKDMPNIVSILIERAGVKAMTRREVRREPESSPGFLGFLKGRKRTISAE